MILLARGYKILSFLFAGFDVHTSSQYVSSKQSKIKESKKVTDV